MPENVRCSGIHWNPPNRESHQSVRLVRDSDPCSGRGALRCPLRGILAMIAGCAPSVSGVHPRDVSQGEGSRPPPTGSGGLDAAHPLYPGFLNPG